MTGKSIIKFITNRLNSGLEEDSKITTKEITELIEMTMNIHNTFNKKEKKKKNNLYNELMLLVEEHE